MSCTQCARRTAPDIEEFRLAAAVMSPSRVVGIFVSWGTGCDIVLPLWGRPSRPAGAASDAIGARAFPVEFTVPGDQSSAAEETETAAESIVSGN